MKKYRKKPGMVWAVQFQLKILDMATARTFCEQNELSTEIFKVGSIKGKTGLCFDTGSSYTIVELGDWIIKDSNGNYYPCTNKIFGETYIEDKK